MDDNSCFVNYIEIVPIDDYGNGSMSSDVEISPRDIKVCMLFTHFLYIFKIVFLEFQ